MLFIETITPESFASFGILLEFSPDKKNDIFEIILTEPQQPWRLAVFRVLNSSVETLEAHPHSFESFEPLSGIGVLLAALPNEPQAMHAFLLDRPICLHKGVWHAMLTLSAQTTVKITENLTVSSEFYPLSDPVCARIVANNTAP